MIQPEKEMLEAQALLPKDKPVALLTRHSIREQCAHGIGTYDLPLTPEGIRLAEQIGNQLDRPVSALYASPVERCVDTALALARGAQKNLPVAKKAVLVEPGCFVHALDKVGALFLQLGPLAFANHHFQNSIDGVFSPHEGSAKIIQHLWQHQGHPGSISIHVTHDTILCAFIYHLLEKSTVQDSDWPKMMEGAWLWFDDEHTLNWIWRGQLQQKSIYEYRQYFS